MKVIGRKFVQDVGVLTIASFVAAALSFVQGILVARWLGPEKYGVVALVMSYPSLLFSFLDARSADASVKYLGEFSARGEKERAVAICKLGYVLDMAIGALTFILVTMTAWWAADHIVHNPAMMWLIVLYAAAFLPRSLAGTSVAILTTLGRFPVLAWVEGLNALLRITLVLGLVVYYGWGVAGVILGNALAMAAWGVVLAVLAYPAVKQTWGIPWLAGSWQKLKGRRREMLRFLVYNDLNTLLGLFVKQFDLVILGYFRGPTEAGYYRLAKSFASAVNYLVRPLQSVTYPEFARLWGADDKQAFRLKVRRLALRHGVLLGSLSLLSILVVPIAIPIFVGQQFLPAAFPTIFLLAGAAFWLTGFWLRPFYLAMGKVRFWFALSLITAVVSVPAFLLSAAMWGYKGISIARFIIAILRNTLAAFNAFRIIRR